jgi:hypothetical protein
MGPAMSNDETTTAQAPVEDSRDAIRPQLRLHHFFVLTAVAAALLALHGQQPDYWTGTNIQPPRVLIVMMMVWTVIYVLIISVAVTALAYGIIWRRMGLKFFDEPGHWLLAEIAVTGLFGMVPTIVFRWIFTSMQGGNSGDFSMVAMTIIGLYSLLFLFALPVILNIYFGLKMCRERRWSWVFYIKAAAKILLGFGDIVVLPFAMNAAWRDRRERFPRDAGHWCGVAVQCALSSFTIVAMFFSIMNWYLMFSQS